MRPITNRLLEARLAEAGFRAAHGSFARHVNQQGRQTAGLVLRYDAASIYWWLRGRTPEDHVQALILDVLKRKIGRNLSRDDLGFTVRAAAGPAPDYPTTTSASIAAVIQLWKLTADGDGPGAAFDPTASILAGWRWSFDPPEPSTSRRGTRTVTAADIHTVRAATAHFLDLDRRLGGADTRLLLIQFLRDHVAPMLNGRYTAQTGRTLFAAAAELTCQAAFMSYDAGTNQELAQRYYIHALRMSRTAADPVLGAHILANLATQAIYLGRPSEAVQLAAAAVHGARRAPARVSARLHSTHASALAIAGETRACARALHTAEKAVDRAADGPAWSRYFGPAHFAGIAIRCFHDLGRPGEALRHSDLALAVDSAGARTSALHTALLATVHAQAGDHDHARALARVAVRRANQVRSARVDARLRSMAQALRGDQPRHRQRAPGAGQRRDP